MMIFLLYFQQQSFFKPLISLRVLLIIFEYLRNMRNYQNWMCEEDQYLRKLVIQHQNNPSWSVVAQKFNQKFKNKTRFAKQCRERFINFIRESQGNKVITEWSCQQVNQMFQIYREIGPRWTEISKRLQTKSNSNLVRSQNRVKNKFYGNLRKAVRSLNTNLKKLMRKNKKQIKFKSIMKILQSAEGRYRLQPQLLMKSKSLREKLLDMAQNQHIQMSQIEIKHFVDDINQFNIAIRSYKCVKKDKQLQKMEKEQKQFYSDTCKDCQRSETNQKASTQDQVQIQGMQQTGSTNKQNECKIPKILLKEQMKFQQIHLPKQDNQKVELMQLQNFFNLQQNQNCQNISFDYFFGNKQPQLNLYDLIFKF